MRLFKRFFWYVVFGLSTLALLAGASALAQGAPKDESSFGAVTSAVADWLHFGYDSVYTAYNPLESTIGVTNVAQLERKWGVGCDDGYFSVISRSPAIADGMLYTSGAGRKLTACSARSGRFLWEFGDGNLGWAPPPVVSEDELVFYWEGMNGLYTLYALDAQSGDQQWASPLQFNIGFNDEALVTVDETRDRVYLVETHYASAKLYALDKQTGQVDWYMGPATDDAEFEGDYVLLDADKIYAVAEVPMVPYPFKGDHLLRIDAATQNIELTYARPEPENYYDIEQYTLCNDRLVAGFDYQYDPVKLLVAYDPITSTIAWQKPFSTTITGQIACNPDENHLYVPTDPYLYVLNATTGEEIWKYTGYGAIYNPSIANGVVYFLSDTNMYAVDEESGARLFSYPLGYSAYDTTQVAVADGMLYFSGNGGTCDLFALGLPGARVFLPLVVRGQ